MKKILLSFSLALISSLPAFSQNVTYSYNFNNGFNELYSRGPVLSSACTGTTATETLPITVTKKVYHFDKGCGIVFNDATKNFLSAGSYTIELYFKLDTVSGYKKIIDFDSLSQDAGYYNQSGKVVLYPNPASPDSMIPQGQYTYLAITRNATSKLMYMNCNGVTAGTYTDNTDKYVYDANKLLVFFQDDKSTNGEQSSGAVAMIHISNYAMDSTTVKSNYTNLHTTLHIASVDEIRSNVTVSPNPATDKVDVTVPGACSYLLSDVTGKVLRTGSFIGGTNVLPVYKLSPGMYLLRVTSKADGSSEVIKLIKQ